MLEVFVISTINAFESDCLVKVVLTPKSITRAHNTVQSTQINQQDCHDVQSNIYLSKLPTHKVAVSEKNRWKLADPTA